MRNENTLVIDSNAIAYRATYTIGGLSSNEKRTGVIFGFLHQVFKYAKKYKTSDIVFCWDSKKSWRRLKLSTYKENRVERRKELDEGEKESLNDAYRQFDSLRKEILFELGFRNIFHAPGYESDDLIAVVVGYFKRDKFIILASDNDLWQLIRSDVVYCGLTNGEEITEKKFIEQYGVPPIEWAEVKAIVGCKGDNVAGIRGIGEKKAIDYILARSKPKDKEKILADWDMVVCNREFVYLPFNDNIVLEDKESEFSKSKFIEVFNRLGFRSFLDKNYFNKLQEVFLNENKS